MMEIGSGQQDGWMEDRTARYCAVDGGGTGRTDVSTAQRGEQKRSWRVYTVGRYGVRIRGTMA